MKSLVFTNKQSFEKGPSNTITDVSGVSVGHCTLSDGDIQTGVTAILPHQGNMFLKKCVAAVDVINGFGKSVGLMQLEELGQLETPIVLTNTLSVGTASDALIKYMLKDNPLIGANGTVNPLVLECNDGFLNDIRAQNITVEHVQKALSKTSTNFEQGSIGAGRGMSAYKLKGGIGSASRTLLLDAETYTVGSLVMSNMGRLEDFCLYSADLKEKLQELLDLKQQQVDAADKGSIIMLIATDLPLDARQLKRVAKRAVVGLAKTGSQLGTGSGDICLAFSTANPIAHQGEAIESVSRYSDAHIDAVFDASIEAIEEAILNSMWHAKSVTGYQKNTRISLQSLLDSGE
jgi:D-aminopeptidase